MNIQKIGDRTAELFEILYYNNEIEPFFELLS